MERLRFLSPDSGWPHGYHLYMEGSHQEPGNCTAWSFLLLMTSPMLCRIHPDKLVPRHWFFERMWENYWDSYSGLKDYWETGRYWEKLSLIGAAFSNLADSRTVPAKSSPSRPGQNTAGVWMVGWVKHLTRCIPGCFR